MSALWIAVSDKAVATIFSDPAIIERVSIVKGWAYVALSGGLLYGLLTRQMASLRQEQEKSDRAQQSLRLFRLLIDRSSENVEVIDAGTYRILDVNEFACQTHGYTREEYLQLTVFDLHPDLCVQDCEGMKELLRKDGSITSQTVHRRKDGTRFMGEATLSMVKLDREYVLAVRRDVSEKKKADENLRLFRSLMDRSGELIEVIDPETGRILDVNEQACRQTGYTRDEYLRMAVFDLRPELTRERFRENQGKMRESGPITFELTHRRKDGRDVPSEINLSLVSLDRDYLVAVIRDITERKQAEAALEESEFRYSSLFENMLNGFAYCQMDYENGKAVDFTYLAVNRAFEQLTGLKDATSRKVSELIPGIRDSDPKLFQCYERVVRTGVPEKTELYVEAMKMWFAVAVYRPRPNHFVTVFDAITERKRVEGALRDSEARFRQVVENINEVFWMCDMAENSMLYVSPAYETVWGRSCASLYSDPMAWLDAIVAEDRDRVAGSFANALTKRRYEETYRIKRPDGSVRWVRDRGFPVAESDGKATRMAGVAEDITEQKLAEVSLRENEERFRLLIENATDVIAVVDAAGCIQFQSPSTERVLGYRADQVMGRPVLDFIHPEDRRRAGEDFARALQGSPAAAPIEYRARHADGSWRVFQSIGRAMTDPDGKKVVVVNARDITETRRLEEQYRQAQKMEAIGTLAGGIAHDFNNILTGIYGFTELARMEAQGMPGVCDKLDQVLKAGTRAADLVRHILTFSRRQGSQRAVVQLHLVVEEPLKLLRATIPTTIEIKRSIDHQAPAVLADPTQIHQILMNLCTNAWNAMRGRPGQLEVILERFVADAAAVAREPRLHAGCYSRLTISDTGCGMDAETLGRAFEPFFTTKGPGEGTGLGLSVVHGIMQSHDGFISVRSQLGQGTTFELYFPAHEEASPVVELKPTPVPRGNGERILVLDDEEPLAMLYCAALEKLGYRAEKLTDPRAALEYVRADPSRFDLVLTDHTMPGLTGVDLAREIRGFAPRLPVILTTGYTGTATPKHFEDAGIKELLPKPPTMDSLGGAVHRVLLKQRPG